jgi:uncharacterized protein YqeY
VSELLSHIKDDMKQAMRAKEKERLATIRLVLAAVKQKEVDERAEITDADVLAILDKMVKQRRESIKQYTEAGREELAEVEQKEIEIIQSYLPQPLADDEIAALVEQAISDSGAQSVRDMGKVMGLLKPQLQGRADVGAVSQQVKAKLN